MLQPGSTATCYGLSPAAMVSWISAFSTELHARTSKYPMIYASFDWWNTCTGNSTRSPPPIRSGSPATRTSPPSAIPAGTATWTLWQSAASGALPGGQDRFNGSFVQLGALAGNPD